MRAVHPDLIPYVRGYNTARDYLEALVIERTAAGAQMAHIRDTKAGWAEADGGASGVDANFIRHDDGTLALKGTLSTILTKAGPPDTYFTDLDRAAPFDVIFWQWGGVEPFDLELSSVEIHLHPRRSGSQKREVVKWRLELMRVVRVLGTKLLLAPICEPVDMPVTGDGEGLVLFDFSTLSARPQPKKWGMEVEQGEPLIPITLGFIYALNASGGAAGNVGLGYDSTTERVTTGGNVLTSFHLTALGSDGLYTAGVGGAGGQGPSVGTPICTVKRGSYTEQTITFSSGNLFDLGGTPTKDVELIGLTQTPPGTSITLRVRNAADTDWVVFTQGQFENADLGLTLIQSKKMQATLTPNAAGNLAPRLRKLGRQAIARIDFSRVATIEGYEQAFDPLTHQVEIPRPRLVGVKDGPKKGPQAFTTKIEQLLAENFINDIRVRWLVGDKALPRSKWIHMEDFLVLDSTPRQPVIELQLVGLCALLKDLAPPFSPGTNYAPDGTHAIGTWTDLAGGTTNIHTHIDETTPDETDGIRSVTSPSNAEYVWTEPTPSDIAGRRLFLDVFYSKSASGGEQIDGKFRIYNGGTLVMESPLQADVGVDPVQKTFELTETQIAQLTDLPNLRGAVVANAPTPGTGRRLHLYWARFRSGGRREVVTYTNQTLKTVYDDLIANRLAIPANLRGPGIESTAHTVSKQITGLRTRKPGAKDVVAKTELEAIALLADRAIGSSEGRIKAFDLSSGQPIRAIFPSRRITIGAASPGHEQRVPEYFGGYRWDATAGEFKDEVRAFHTQSLLKIGTVGLGPPKWWDEELGKWIDTDALAQEVVQRPVNRLGTGKMLWSWDSSDRYAELEICDVVAVETDLFASRDPNLDREIKGRRWAIGPLQRVGQGWFFTIHPRGYADILASVESGSRVLALLLQESNAEFRADHIFASWVGGPHVRSVKVATSTTSQPAAGTGTAVDGASGEYDAGAFVYADKVYVTITPYTGLGATGLQGTATLLPTRRLPQIHTWIDLNTGKPKRTQDFTDGDYAVAAASNDGLQVVKEGQIEGQVRTLYTALTHLLPNGEFEVWQSASQPHAWTVDTGDSSVAAKDTSVVFSGDAAAKYSFGAGGSGATWRGLATNDPTKGGQCIALRPGFRYRVIAASRVSTLTGAPKYRLRFQYDAGASLTDEKQITYRAATTYQRDEFVITVPATADPNSKFWVEFQRGDTNAKDFWIDSVRFEEEVASLADQAAQLAGQGTSFVLNGSFEEGLSYWQQTSGGSLFTTTSAPPEGGTAGAILTVGSSTHRVRQCDRSSNVGGNPADGNPVFLPVEPFDEIWGVCLFGTTSATSVASTWRFGVEEYDSAKALIQRQYCGSGSIVQGTTTTLRGGVVLSSTTKYVVAILEVLPTAGYDGVTIKFDGLRLFWNAARRRCLAFKSGAAQSLTNGTEAAISFDAETYDIGTLHDNATNNTRITVPAEMVGRGGVRLVGQVTFEANATGYRRLRWRKTLAAGGTVMLASKRIPAVATASITTEVQCVARDEAPAAGDYYELLATQNSGGALNAVQGTRDVTFGEAVHDY